MGLFTVNLILSARNLARLALEPDDWVRTSALPLPSCVTLGALTSLCFLVHKMGIIIVPASLG